MRRYILLIILACSLFACNDNGKQNIPAESNHDSVVKDPSVKDTAIAEPVPDEQPHADQPIIDIRNEYNRINSIKTAETKHKFVCDTDGSVIYYTEENKVVKIVIDWGFIGHGSTKTEYYYKDSKLIFIFETYTGGPVDGPDTTTEYRTYVKDDQTIRYMEGQQRTPCKKCSFPNTSRPYKILQAYNTGKVQAALCP